MYSVDGMEKERKIFWGRVKENARHHMAESSMATQMVGINKLTDQFVKDLVQGSSTFYKYETHFSGIYYDKKKTN